MSTANQLSNPPIPPNDSAANILTVEETLREAGLEEVLDDLSSRFILNMPEPELSSTERISFQIEQAHWYYEDFVRPLNPAFPSMNLKRFSALLFKACPLLSEVSHEQAFEDFQRYKSRVPVCGAILLNPKMDKCVLVKGWKSTSAWSFPKGKINQDESRHACAIREVREETGFDFGAVGLLDKNAKAEMEINQQSITLYFVVGVPEDTEFETQTRKEISKIEWFRLVDLPTWNRKKAVRENGKFYLISPFVAPLRAFVQSRRPATPLSTLDNNRQAAPPLPQPQGLQRSRVESFRQDTPPQHSSTPSISKKLPGHQYRSSFDSPVQPAERQSRLAEGHVLGDSDRSSSPGPVTPPAGPAIPQGGQVLAQVQPVQPNMFSKSGPASESEAARMSQLLSVLSTSTGPVAQPVQPPLSQSEPPPAAGKIAKHLALLESLIEPMSGLSTSTSQSSQGPPQFQSEPQQQMFPGPPAPSFPQNAHPGPPLPPHGTYIPNGPLPPVPAYPPPQSLPPSQSQPAPFLHNPQATYPYYPPSVFGSAPGLGPSPSNPEIDHKGALLSMLSTGPPRNTPPSAPPAQPLYQSPMPLLQGNPGAGAPNQGPPPSLPGNHPMHPQQGWGMLPMSPPSMNNPPPMNNPPLPSQFRGPLPPNMMPPLPGGFLTGNPLLPFHAQPPPLGPSMLMSASNERMRADVTSQTPSFPPAKRPNVDFPYSGPSPGTPLQAFFPRGVPAPQHRLMPNIPFPNQPNASMMGGPFPPFNDPQNVRQPEHLLAILNSGPRPAA